MRRVWTFFYGSFMNQEVLAEAGVEPTERQLGRLDGWALEVAPRATLVPTSDGSVYGVLARITHNDIDKIYSKDWFGFGVYLPEAVVVCAAGNAPTPALCYICWQMETGKPSKSYLDKMLAAAREFNFPDDYVHHIGSFI